MANVYTQTMFWMLLSPPSCAPLYLSSLRWQGSYGMGQNSRCEVRGQVACLSPTGTDQRAWERNWDGVCGGISYQLRGTFPGEVLKVNQSRDNSTPGAKLEAGSQGRAEAGIEQRGRSRWWALWTLEGQDPSPGWDFPGTCLMRQVSTSSSVCLYCQVTQGHVVTYLTEQATSPGRGLSSWVLSWEPQPSEYSPYWHSSHSTPPTQYILNLSTSKKSFLGVSEGNWISWNFLVHFSVRR